MRTKFQKTKILATVGPACNDYNNLLALVQAGVDVFRLNFSHGSHDDHLKTLNYIQYINKKFNLNVGILGDLQGPKLRVGEMENGGLPIKPGDILTFVNEKCVGNAQKIYMSYPSFAQDVKVGEKVLLDDGKIELEVVETNKKNTVKLKVLFGSVLSSKKGVNLPDTNVSLPSVTEKDAEDLEFMLKHDFNWIALSFVRRADDIHDLRRRIAAKQHKARIVAKIEKPEAVVKIDEIIAATDAVMVARGDLGIEMPIEQLPLTQKDIVARCIKAAKPVIVATQMMDSMITNPSPTRAEVNDVANAVMDGADAVMLSGETSVGQHPALVVEAMVKIISVVEEKREQIYYRNHHPDPNSPNFLSDALCYNACVLAKELNATTLIGMTKSGYTGYQLSSHRPKGNIFILSSDSSLLGTLSLVWGTRCFFYDKFTSTDETIADSIELLRKHNLAAPGDVVINLGSMPLHERRRTNMLKITKVE